jgi:hypothetical protein
MHGLRVEQSGSTLRIDLPRERKALRTSFICAVGLVVLGCLSIAVVRDPALLVTPARNAREARQQLIAFLGLLGFVGAPVALLAVLGLSKASIIVRSSQIEFGHAIGPLRWTRRRDRSSIRGLRVDKRWVENLGWVWSLLYIRGGRTERWSAPADMVRPLARAIIAFAPDLAEEAVVERDPATMRRLLTRTDIAGGTRLDVGQSMFLVVLGLAWYAVILGGALWMTRLIVPTAWRAMHFYPPKEMFYFLGICVVSLVFFWWIAWFMAPLTRSSLWTRLSVTLTPDECILERACGPLRWTRALQRASISGLRVGRIVGSEALRFPPVNAPLLRLDSAGAPVSFGVGVRRPRLEALRAAMLEIAPELARPTPADQVEPSLTATERIRSIKSEPGSTAIEVDGAPLTRWTHVRLLFVWPLCIFLIGMFFLLPILEMGAGHPLRASVVVPWFVCAGLGWLAALSLVIAVPKTRRTITLSRDALQVQMQLGPIRQTKREDHSAIRNLRAVAWRPPGTMGVRIRYTEDGLDTDLVAGLTPNDALLIRNALVSAAPALGGCDGIQWED